MWQLLIGWEFEIGERTHEKLRSLSFRRRKKQRSECMIVSQLPLIQMCVMQKSSLSEGICLKYWVVFIIRIGWHKLTPTVTGPLFSARVIGVFCFGESPPLPTTPFVSYRIIRLRALMKYRYFWVMVLYLSPTYRLVYPFSLTPGRNRRILDLLL